MPRFKGSLLGLMLLTHSSRVLAQEVQAIPPGEDKIVVVHEGEKAPFTGQLFDGPTALRWVNWLQQYKFRLKADVDFQKRNDLADLTLARALLAAEQDKYKLVTTAYQNKAAEDQRHIVELTAQVENPPWYRTTWFGATLGAAVVTIAVGLGAFALHQAK